MQPYVERMKAEKEELDIKRNKLVGFLSTETYKELSEEEQGLLQIQYDTMTTYSLILELRIKLSERDSA